MRISARKPTLDSPQQETGPLAAVLESVATGRVGFDADSELFSGVFHNPFSSARRETWSSHVVGEARDGFDTFISWGPLVSAHDPVGYVGSLPSCVARDGILLLAMPEVAGCEFHDQTFTVQFRRACEIPNVLVSTPADLRQVRGLLERGGWQVLWHLSATVFEYEIGLDGLLGNFATDPSGFKERLALFPDVRDEVSKAAMRRVGIRTTVVAAQQHH